MTALGNNSLTTVSFQLQFVIEEHLRETAIVAVIDRMVSCWNMKIKTESYKNIKPSHEDQRACLDKTPQETASEFWAEIFEVFFSCSQKKSPNDMFWVENMKHTEYS